MARVVITIHPTVSDERLLGVADAMQQVLDHIKLFEDAQQAMGDPHSRFEWKLERASTNTPFTVVAVADTWPRRGLTTRSGLWAARGALVFDWRRYF